MKSTQISSSVRALRDQGRSLHEISRLLRLSRNTVRRILRQGDAPAAGGGVLDAALQRRLEDVFARARGNAVRMAQILAEEHDMALPYSTLTRWVRQAELRAAPKRSGQYAFAPGQEMQHDTSPQRVVLGGRQTKLQCASLVLAYSRRLLARYYLQFTRLEAKHFLLEAARFMQGCCTRCVIDNTSVIVVGGAGAQAVFAPEMVAFAATLGFGFMAHGVGHCDRKAVVERDFLYLETNFLPGRTFADLQDLNAQALRWCEHANAKPKRALGMSAEAAYALEAPCLRQLPAVLPPAYEVLDRVVDLYGFVSVDTNRYSVPERLVGKTVTVYKHYERVEVYWRGSMVAGHERVIGQRDVRRTLPGHHTVPQRVPREPTAAEQQLATEPEVLQRYAAALKLHHRHGRGVRALHRLVQIKRTYPREPFLAAVQQALKFGLFDLTRLEHLVLRHVAGDFFALAHDDEDDDEDGHA